MKCLQVNLELPFVMCSCLLYSSICVSKSNHFQSVRSSGDFLIITIIFFIFFVKSHIQCFMESAAYCVVAKDSVGKQISIAFLERVKADFRKRYGGGKADTAIAKSLNKEFGYVHS